MRYIFASTCHERGSPSVIVNQEKGTTSQGLPNHTLMCVVLGWNGRKYKFTKEELESFSHERIALEIEIYKFS